MFCFSGIIELIHGGLNYSRWVQWELSEVLLKKKKITNPSFVTSQAISTILKDIMKVTTRVLWKK